MDIKDFVTELSIPTTGDFKDNQYVLTLDGSNEYANIYTKLDKSDLVDLDVEKMALTEHSVYLPYLGDEYDVILQGDLDKNVYSVTVSLGEE